MASSEDESGEAGVFPLLDKGGALGEGATRVAHEASVNDSPGASRMGSVQRLLKGWR